MSAVRLPTEQDTSLLLPDPDPRPVRYPIISVDDHLVEPPDMFTGRVPARFRDAAPRVVETEDGAQVWEFDGQRFTQVGLNAVAGRRPEHYSLEPARFDQMRRGCWDLEARVADMDAAGVWASMNFPSMITGFCARVFSGCSDPDLGLAVTRAWNDWLYEEWYSPHPDRIVPLQIPWLADPEVAAAEVRRNAARGFRAISLPERPHRIGLPSVASDHWEPLLAACAETGTVVALHVGSTGLPDLPPDAPALQLGGTLFPALSLQACAEWLWSGHPVRFPDLRILMAEGGIGWVAMLMDRLDNIVDRARYTTGWDSDLRPTDVLARNFWFGSIDDPSTVSTRHRIGIENILLETDYPHSDGTWPDVQRVVLDGWADASDAELRAVTHENAAALLDHPLPDPTWLAARQASA